MRNSEKEKICIFLHLGHEAGKKKVKSKDQAVYCYLF